MALAVTKVSAALGNLTKLKSKLLQICEEEGNAKYNEFVAAQLSPKEVIVDELTAKYQTLLRTKTLAGKNRPATAAEIKESLGKDSKTCAMITSTMQVAMSMN